MGLDRFFDELQREWPVIRQAPLLFFSALALLSAAVGALIHALYKSNLDRKNDLIKTLQDQLAREPAGEPRTQEDATCFTVLLEGGNVFVPDGEPSWTGIALDVLVVNSGKRSLAVDWQMIVAPPDGHPRNAQLTRIPKVLTAKGTYHTTHITEGESLVESTLASPLETNVPRRGKLLFYVILPKAKVLQSVLELSVSDIKGNRFTARQDVQRWLHRG